MQHPIQILERYWNFTSFKPLQKDIINAVIENEDTFALLPTGGGKSICFQIPALAKEGICIVISPLIALMKNQVQILKTKGIKAIALTNDYNYEDVSIMLDNCIYGNYKFLYLSPERLQNEIVQERIKQMNVNLIAVDEAHCISQWGNDFRPAYKDITLLRELQPSVNVIALTASATPKVINDTIKSLDFINPKVFKQSFKREHLAYMVFEAEDKQYKIQQILKKNTASSIIYVRNRKSTVNISKQLINNGFTSTYYHGGLTNKEKDINFSEWLNNKKQVMVATNAFGMGIDKPDVKTVIHVNFPESIESYFQEAGRAGRGGQKAFAVILKHKGDEQLLKNQFLSVIPTVDFVKKVYRKLCNYFQISYGEGALTTHQFNFNDFCKTYRFNKLTTYNAIQILDRTSVLNLTPQFNNRTTVQFLTSNTKLFSYIETHKTTNTIIKTILRTYGGIFDQSVKIDINLIADKSSNSEATVIAILQNLEKDAIISLKLIKTDADVTFIQPREDDKTINRIAATIEQQNALKKNQVASVLNYVYNDNICKSVQLLSYFGETDTEDCGICSVCIHNKTKVTNQIELDKLSKIISTLKEKELTSRELSELLHIKSFEINQLLKQLLENNYITITNINTYKLK